MDWLGGLNSMDDYTDNVNSFKPNEEKITCIKN